MADFFRKSSIEKLSNPEQLDRSIKISSPMSWLALIGVFLVIIATLIWSIVGVLPTTQSTYGILVNSESSSAFYSNKSGSVTNIYKKPGDKVSKGDDIIKIKSSDGKEYIIETDSDGTITELLVDYYSEIYSGTEIARFTPAISQNNVVVCFVPLMEAKQLKAGMEVILYPSSVDSRKYGHMEAEIFSVSKFSVNASNLKYVVGSDNLIADQFVNNGPIISVICKIKTDSSSNSGYYWSTENGKNLTVSNGTLMSAKIVIDECAPITKLFNNLKEQLEG